MIYPKYNFRNGTWLWKSTRTGFLMGTTSFRLLLMYPFTRAAWRELIQ